MRKIPLYLLYICVISTAVTCSSAWDDKYGETAFGAVTSISLSAGTAELSYESQGGANEVPVAANVPWTVSSGAAWLTVNRNDAGTSFSVICQPNMSLNERQATLTVSGVGLSHAIAVSQRGVTAPIVGTPSVGAVEKHSANCQFSFTSADLDATACGVCYSPTASEPTTDNATLRQDNSGRSGQVAFALTGLDSKTTYHLRAFITTALGTHYSEPVEFTTLASVPNEGDNGTPQE